VQELIPTLAQKMNVRYAPELVETWPVKDVVLKGDEVDLAALPVHIAGTRDGGPCIGSGLVITMDPDTGHHNLSFHRLQVKGKNKTGILMVSRHTWLNYQKWEARDEPMPVAIFIGHHPAYYLAAATTGPYGMNELEIAGGLLEEPVKLVRCETHELEVPCDAEIVLEGYVLPHVREEEGPFSEFHDYYIAGMGRNPVVEIKAVTMRKDAIYKALQNGSEMEGCAYHKVPMAAAIYQQLQNVSGYVDLKNVRVIPGVFGLVVQMTPRFYGEAKNVLLAALSSTYLHIELAIAVDDDVNIYNDWEILWSLTTRTDPAKDMVIVPDTRAHPMDLTAMELYPPGTAAWQRVGSKVLIDATKPPVCDPKARDPFERVRPAGLDSIRVEDYL
jgi:2,5-furandicarboxylate decarboxylase 1